MKRFCVFLFLVAIAVAQTPAPSSVKKTAFDKKTFEAWLRHLNLWGPQITIVIAEPKPALKLPGFSEVAVKASLGPRSIDVNYLVSRDGRKILQGTVYDIAQNPFKDDLGKLKTEGQPSMGTPGATAVMVLFSDFECSYCREEARALRENLLKTYPTQVRLYFKDFPLEAIHPWAKAASVASRCVYKQSQDAFWAYHDWIFENQAGIRPENLKDKVLEFAKTKALDALQLTRCIDSQATLPEVEQNIAEGKALGVNSTPTLFLNGRRMTGKLDWAELKSVVDQEIEYQKTAKNAGEDCGCELALPVAPGTLKPNPVLK